jgi:hypothetical protein
MSAFGGIADIAIALRNVAPLGVTNGTILDPKM